MPDKVRMAKHCKFCIAQKAELGGGTGQYGMLQDQDMADNDPEEGVHFNYPHVVAPVLPQPIFVPMPPPSINLNKSLCLTPLISFSSNQSISSPGSNIINIY